MHSSETFSLELILDPAGKCDYSVMFLDGFEDTGPYNHICWCVFYMKTKYDCCQKAYFDEFKIASVLHAFFSISNSCESLWRLN